MAWVNFIINLAGLVLWLNWLVVHLDPLAGATAASLAGTLKRAEAAGSGRWKYLAGLLTLLPARAWVYLQTGGITNWTPKVNLGVIVLSFRSDLPWDALLFSLLSFGLTLAVFHLCLLLLSIVNSQMPDADPWQKLVWIQLRWIKSWPGAVKLLLPFIAGGLAWVALHPLLSRMEIVPASKSGAQLLAQGAVIGAATYLAWAWLILPILLLHMLNSYIYLGNLSLWNYTDATARNFLLPLRRLPLRFGKVDLLPLLVTTMLLAVDFLVARPPERWRTWIYERLPF